MAMGIGNHKSWVGLVNSSEEIFLLTPILHAAQRCDTRLGVGNRKSWVGLVNSSEEIFLLTPILHAAQRCDTRLGSIGSKWKMGPRLKEETGG